MSETLHDRIRERLAAVGLNPNEASVAAGLSRGYLQTVFNREKEGGGAAASKLAKLAPVLETTVDYLVSGKGPSTAPTSAATSNVVAFTPSPNPLPPQGERRMLKVHGLAAAAIAGHLAITDEPIEYVPAPAALIGVRDAYALIVTGSSMEPRYFAGDVIFINPHRPPRQGDHVVIQEAREGGVVASIKRFERATENKIVAVQYNPLSTIEFNRKAVIAMHRVLTPNEVAGV